MPPCTRSSAFHTAGARKALLTRAVLAIVGVLLGFVAASLAVDGAMAALSFAQGFGLAHVPAALILFFKRARREGRS
jgi:hypothetical protein